MAKMGSCGGRLKQLDVWRTECAIGARDSRAWGVRQLSGMAVVALEVQLGAAPGTASQGSGLDGRGSRRRGGVRGRLGQRSSWIGQRAVVYSERCGRRSRSRMQEIDQGGTRIWQ